MSKSKQIMCMFFGKGKVACPLPAEYNCELWWPYKEYRCTEHHHVSPRYKCCKSLTLEDYVKRVLE